MSGLLELVASWPGSWRLIVLLALVALVHEDVAMVVGAYFATSDRLSPISAFCACFAGMLSGDVLIYAAGMLARRIGWLRRALIHERVERFGRWIDRSLLGLVLVCKTTPGLLFPMYMACGWFRVSFPRFFIATSVASALYGVIVFLALHAAGATVLKDAGPLAWLAAAGAILAISLLGGRKPRWRRIDAMAARTPRIKDLVTRAERTLHARTHRGMPALAGLRRHIASAESIPPALFYLPLFLRWLWYSLRYRSLTLPSTANPAIEGGGFWGESKAACLNLIAPEHRAWVAPFTIIQRGNGPGVDAEYARAAAFLRSAGTGYPVVAKPDIGWQGFGVQLVPDEAHLRDYLERFPRGAALILQEYVPWDGEAGVFYVRHPREERGRLLSLTLRYFPHVHGDGATALRTLILQGKRSGWKAHLYFGESEEHAGFTDEELDRVPAAGELVRLAFIGSIRAGGLYRDATAHITPAMTDRFDAIARGMPEFHFGRFDVKFGSLEELQRGEGFRIIEVNGAGSENIQAWDPEKPLHQTYSGLFRAQEILFDIAAANRARGFTPIRLAAFIRLSRNQHRLIKRYPKAM